MIWHKYAKPYSARYILESSDYSVRRETYVQTNICSNSYLIEMIISYNLPYKTSNGPKSPITFRVDTIFWEARNCCKGWLSHSWGGQIRLQNINSTSKPFFLHCWTPRCNEDGISLYITLPCFPRWSPTLILIVINIQHTSLSMHYHVATVIKRYLI